MVGSIRSPTLLPASPPATAPATVPMAAPTGPPTIPAANPAPAPPNAAPTPVSTGCAPASLVIGSALRLPLGGKSTFLTGLGFLTVAMTALHNNGKGSYVEI